MKWPIIFLPLALASCEREKMPREQAVKLAREAAQDAFTQLSGELAKSIEIGGPVAAIPVCSGKAGSIVAGVAAKRQLAMVRLSDRPRNSTQAAQGSDLAAMETFRAAVRRGETPVPLDEAMADGSTVLRLPITVSQPLCLQCHGSESDITAETRKAILAVYPGDKATGYSLNDLRGIWRITVPPQ